MPHPSSIDRKTIANDIVNRFMHKGARVDIKDYEYVLNKIDCLVPNPAEECGTIIHAHGIRCANKKPCPIHNEDGTWKNPEEVMGISKFTPCHKCGAKKPKFCSCKPAEPAKLEDIIKSLKFDYVNSDITSANFPPQPIRGELVVKQFDRYISSEDAIKEMEKEGLVPANLNELLEYAKDSWNGKDLMMALGSVYVDSHGGRDVPCLDHWYAERELDLDYWGGEWGPDYRFLAVRKALSPSESVSSVPLEPLPASPNKCGREKCPLDYPHSHMKMIRPALENLGGNIQCSCGDNLLTRPQIIKHWQQGHFDYPAPGIRQKIEVALEHLIENKDHMCEHLQSEFKRILEELS